MKLLTLIITLLLFGSAYGKELLISSAAGIMELTKEAGKRFSEEKGVKVYYNFSSSGKLAKQIEGGAPVDCFVSASKRWTLYLKEKGLVEEETITPVAKTRLVVVAPKGSEVKSLEEAQTVAVGNRFAPVGRYALESLKNLGLYEKVKDKLIFAPTVRQITLWVISGNADAGIIYYPDYLKYKDKLKLIEILPESSHSPIYFYGSCTKRGGELCREFLEEFKKLPPEVYRSFGFKKVERAER